MLTGGIAVFACVGSSCQHECTDRGGPRPTSSEATVSSSAGHVWAWPELLVATQGREPATIDDRFVVLDVAGFHPARIAVPLEARAPRPVLVALHGHRERPESTCATWSFITSDFPFVLCPAGEPIAGTNLFTYESQDAVEREIANALVALRGRFGAYVDRGPVLLTGFSLGAVRAAGLLERQGRYSPAAALVEGAYERLTPEFARHFVDTGGRRLLLACSQAICEGAYRRYLRAFADAGVDVHIVYSGGDLHRFDRATAARVRDAWPWLVGGESHWSAPK